MVTKHELLEELNSYSTELLKHKQEKDAVQIKNEVCNLNQRWDRIYEELKLREKSCQDSLALWHNYQAKKKKMNDFLRSISEKIETLDVCMNEKELEEKTTFFKVSKQFLLELVEFLSFCEKSYLLTIICQI